MSLSKALCKYKKLYRALADLKCSEQWPTSRRSLGKKHITKGFILLILHLNSLNSLLDPPSPTLLLHRLFESPLPISWPLFLFCLSLFHGHSPLTPSASCASFEILKDFLRPVCLHVRVWLIYGLFYWISLLPHTPVFSWLTRWVSFWWTIPSPSCSGD